MSLTLKVFNVTEEPEVKPTRLRLVPILRGIAVEVVDNNGNRLSEGSLVEFRNDGTLYLNGLIGTKYGFKLDRLGRLVVKK